MLLKLFEDLVTTTASIERASVMERISKDPAKKVVLEGFNPQQSCDKEDIETTTSKSKTQVHYS